MVSNSQTSPNGTEPGTTARPVPPDAIDRLGESEPADVEEYEGAVARTMFDVPAANDGTVTVVIAREHLEDVANQALVRVVSRSDGRRYLGAITAGPFTEPDGLRGDAPVLVTSAAHRAVFMPSFHGRAQIQILGEETEDGIVPPRRRPHPNSPVYLLEAKEAAELLRSEGEVRLGLVEGLEEVEVRLRPDKNVLPRHLGILGTTGGGKSTTVARLLAEVQRARTAVVILDTEGEYTAIHEPTTDPRMLRALERRGLSPAGVEGTQVRYLVGRETANPQHPDAQTFSLEFAELSPYAVMEILALTEAQEERFLRAYDVTKLALDRLRIYPANQQEQDALIELDELESGYPRMTLAHLYDVVRLQASDLANEPTPAFDTPAFRDHVDELRQIIGQLQLPKNVPSWRALQGRLGRIRRLRIFDNSDAPKLAYQQFIHPGRVTIIDLSDTDSPQVNNLVIAQLLRGLQRAQEEQYEQAVRSNKTPTPLLLLIEEAHEFLSAERIKQMPVLFSQVARVARRGRKRWFGLVFITQLPQHLPDEVLGLINNWVLHKLTDSNVIGRLRRSIGGIDEGLWQRLPNLAPGQAVVSFTGHTRAMLTSIDPAPCRLLMVE